MYDHGDHVHELCVNSDGKLEPVTNFPYDQVDQNLNWSENKEDMVSFADFSAAFSMILEYLTKGRGDKPTDLTVVGARCESLLWLLQPTQSHYHSLADIAAAAGVTRAALSAHLLSFKDQIGLAISGGKAAYHRDSCRRAQKAAVAAGGTLQLSAEGSEASE